MAEFDESIVLNSVQENPNSTMNTLGGEVTAGASVDIDPIGTADLPMLEEMQPAPAVLSMDDLNQLNLIESLGMDQLVQKNIADAQTKDPKEISKIRKLTIESQLPKELVERNVEDIQKMVAQQKMRELELSRVSPVLSRQLRDPDFAALAKADVEDLSYLEISVNAIKRGIGAFDQFKSIALYGADKALTGVGIHDQSDVFKDRLMSSVKEYDAIPKNPFLDEYNRVVEKAESDPTKNSFVEAVSFVAKHPSILTDLLLEQVPGLAFGGVAGAALGAGVKSTIKGAIANQALARYLSTSTTLAAVGGLSVPITMLGPEVSEGLSKGMTLDDAIGRAITKTSVEAGITAIGGFIPAPGITVGVARGVGQQTGAVLLEAVKQGGVGALAAAMGARSVGEEASIGELYLEALGGIVTVPADVGSVIYQDRALRKKQDAKKQAIEKMQAESQKAKMASTTEAQLNEVAKRFLNTDIAKNSPESAQELLGALFQKETDTEADLSKAYFSTEDVQALKESGIDLGEIYPQLAETLQQSEVTGGYVEIDAQDYVVGFIGNEDAVAQLNERVRFNVNDMNGVESRQWEIEQQAKFEAEAQKIMTAQAEDQAYMDQVEKVKTQFKSQVLAAGRDESEAEIAGDLAKNFAVVHSMLEGISPEEFANKYMLNIQSGIEVQDAQAQALSQSKPFDGPEIAATPIDVVAIPFVEVDGVNRSTTNSNGQPIHSTIEGVRNFWRWFGDSKVVDADGKPLVVYHGTNAEFNIFRPSTDGVYGPGSYLTMYDGDAATYGRNVMPVYASLQNPYVTTLNEARSAWKYGGTKAWSKSIEGRGYDGIMLQDMSVVVAFSPNQIKSAISNVGAFDPANPNILQQSVESQLANDNGEGTSAWERAKAKGLDMSQEARLERARAMGFDTDTVYYHGTDKDFDAFETGMDGSRQYGMMITNTKSPFVFFGENKDLAKEFAESKGGDKIYSVYLNKAKALDTTTTKGFLEFARIFDVDLSEFSLIADDFENYQYQLNEYKDLLSDDVTANKVLSTGERRIDFQKQQVDYAWEDIIEKFDYIQEDTTGLWEELDGIDSLNKLKEYGYDSVILTEDDFSRSVAIGDVSSIRSINAAFDPEQAESANIFYQMAGPNAQGADLEALARAQGMAGNAELSDSEMENIRQKTGWMRGPDGMWRAEISDDQAAFKNVVFDDQGNASLPLGELLKHDKLYEAYPNAKNITVELLLGKPSEANPAVFVNEQGAAGVAELKENKIVIYHGGDNAVSANVLSTLLHEIQHFIQMYEGFMNGGDSTPATVKFIMDGLERERTRYSYGYRLYQDYEDLLSLHYLAKNLEFAKSMINDANPKDKAMLDARLEKLQARWDSASPTDKNTLSRYRDPVKELSEKMDKVRFDAEKAKDLDRQIQMGNELINSDQYYEFYMRLLGEAEARLTESRKDLTDAQRAATPIEYDRPVPYLFVSGKNMRNAGRVSSSIVQTMREANQDVLFQQARGQIQFPVGGVTQGSTLITLFEKANRTTIFHELGHYFFEVKASMAAQPNAPQSIVDDVNVLLDYMGVGAGNLDQWMAMPLEERRAGHEKVARSFEAYLMEGKAPSLEMQGIFRQLKRWFVEIYKSILPLNVKLNDEVRSVFDRMLASQEAIDDVRLAENYAPMFESQQSSGLNAVQWDEYLNLDRESIDAAQEKLDERGVRNLKWLDNARSKIIKGLQRQARDKRMEVRNEVRREILSQPVYRLWSFLTGKVDKLERLPKETSMTSVDVRKDHLFVAMAKLGGINKQDVMSQWGFDPSDKIEAPVFGKPVLRSTNGLTLDDMGQELANYGYLPVDENGKFDMHDFEDAFFAQHRGDNIFSLGRELFVEEDVTPVALDPELVGAGKLNLQELKDLFGDSADAVWRQIPKSMIRSDGWSLSAVADAFGFSSPGEMITALLHVAQFERPNDVVENVTDQRMMERYADLVDPAQLKAAADEMLQNEARAKMVTIEYNALAKMTGKPTIMRAAARAFAGESVGKMLIRALKPGQYRLLANKARKNALSSSKAGNTEEAAKHKRIELLNTEFTRETMTGLAEIEKGLSYLKKFNSKTAGKRLDPDYLEQIHAILEAFDLRKGQSLKTIDNRKSLIAWVEEQRELGMQPIIDESLLSMAEKKHYRDMTLDEWRSMIDAIKSIESLGRLKNKLLRAKNQRQFDDAKAEIIESIEKNATREIKQKLEENAFGADVKKGISEFFAAHRKVSSIMREMDGGKDGGALWEYYLRTMNDAGTYEASNREKSTVALGELFKLVMKPGLVNNLKTKLFIPEIGDSLSHEGRLAIALNWGNDVNRLRVMDGNKWSGDQVDAVLKTLSEDDWQFVQGVWDYIDSYWPQIAAKEKRVTGVAPEKVIAMPFKVTLADGREVFMRGGYYPIKYDASKTSDSRADLQGELAKQAMMGAVGHATTRRGHTKERGKKGLGPVRLDLGVIVEHLDQVIHDLAWHEWLIDANKLMNDSEIHEAMMKHYDPLIIKQIKLGIKDIAAGDLPPFNAMDAFLNRLRHGTSIVGMGWSLMTGLLQPFGITQSIVRVGPKWVGRGMAKMLGNAAMLENTSAEIYRKSEFMRLRSKTMQLEIAEIKNKIRASVKIGPVQESYFYLITQVQKVVDIPTWLGAYEKAISEGSGEDRAVALADQAVLDAQGGGQVKDQALIQRGSPALKLFNNFYSFFNTTYNLLVESGKAVKIKDPFTMGRFAVDVLLLITIPAVLSEFMREALKGGEECEDDLCLDKIAKFQLNYMLGMMVGVRELSGLVTGFDYSGPAGLRIMGEIYKIGKDLEDADLSERGLKALNNAGGIIFHYPAGQVQRTVEAIIGYSEGESENPLDLFLGPRKEY